MNLFTSIKIGTPLDACLNYAMLPMLSFLSGSFGCFSDVGLNFCLGTSKGRRLVVLRAAGWGLQGPGFHYDARFRRVLTA